MASTIWDDAIGDERPLTKDEVCDMRDKTEAFIGAINQYITARNGIDPAFQCAQVNLDDKDCALYIYPPTDITIEWRQEEYCRGRGREDYQRSFPLAHLWDPNWEQAIRAEVAENQRLAEQAKLKAEQDAARKLAASKAADEEKERELLKLLQAKYGAAS